MQCCFIKVEPIIFEAHKQEAKGTTVLVVKVLVIVFNVVVVEGEVLVRVLALELGGVILLS